jgi:hypothetical protein
LNRAARGDGTDRAGGRSALLPCLATLALLLLFLPFVDKAFHIDDYAFMNLARMIGWNPLQALPVDYDYTGRIIPQLLPYEITHPLLVPYFIKMVVALGGEGEIPLHVAFLVFPLLAGLSLIKLLRLFTAGGDRSSLLALLFFFSMPAVLVNGQNLMTDLPTLAFLLWGMASYGDWFSGGSRRSCYTGGVALTLAVFCSYQMLAFVPLLGGYALYRRRVDRHLLLSLALPIVVLSAWLLAVYLRYDIFPLVKSRIGDSNASIGAEISKGLKTKNLINKSLATVSFFGASLLWLLPLHHLLRRSLMKFLAGLALLTPLCLLLTGGLNSYTLLQQGGVAFFLALGVMALGTFVRIIRQRRSAGEPALQELFLFCWVLVVLAYVILLFPFGSARYIMPALPPALLLLTGGRDWLSGVATRPTLMAVVLCGSLLFGLACATADYRFAGVYREFAGEVQQLRAEAGNNPDVWFIGEWGMNYYLRKAGARYLHATSTAPRLGDYLVIPEMPPLWGPAEALRSRLDVAATREFRSPLPLRLFNRRSRAGFYAHFWGMLPFAFSREPDEVFTLLRVVR